MWRNRHAQNVRNYSKDQVSNWVAKRMIMRHHLLAPCPIKPVDIYRYLWTKDERAALRTLKASIPSILRKDSDVTLDWDVCHFTVDTPLTPVREPLRLYTLFGRDLPLPNTDSWNDDRERLGISRMPPQLLQSLLEWGKQWMKLDIEREYVCAKAEQVFNVCNTMGQVHRLWPNLCSFMPERAQEILRKKKVRSKLPEAVLHYDDETDPENERPLLDDEWKPAALAPYDALITEALLLPEIEVKQDWPIKIIHGPVAC